MVMPIDGQSRRDGNLFADFFLLRRPLARLTIDARAELICPSQTAFAPVFCLLKQLLPRR
jgi:hypothetical protein